MSKKVRGVSPKEAGSQKKRTTFDIYKDVGLAALQGVSLGSSDEIIAGIMALSPNITYKDAVKNLRDDMERFRETDPVKAYGAEIIASMFTGAGIMGTGARFAAKKGVELTGKKLIGAGGLQGAVEGGIYGGMTGETAGERAAGVGIGTLTGAAGGALGQYLMPRLQEGAEALLKKGYPLTAGQAYGGKVGSFEQKVSTPYLQESIAEARRRPQEMFMGDVVNQAIVGTGKTIPKGMVGEEAVDAAVDIVSEAYDAVVPYATMNTSVVQELASEISNSRLALKSFDEKDSAEFAKIIADAITKNETNGALIGQNLKDAETSLTQYAYDLKRKGDTRMLSAVREVQEAFRQEVADQNPELPDLQIANRAFRNLKPIITVSDRAAGNKGLFTPTALLKEERKLRSRGAPEVVQARQARDILGATVPDSGTAGRLQMGLGGATGRKVLGGAANIALGTLAYDYPKGGRALAKLPAAVVGYGTPAITGLLSDSIPRLDITLDDRQQSLLGQ